MLFQCLWRRTLYPALREREEEEALTFGVFVFFGVEAGLALEVLLTVVRRPVAERLETVRFEAFSAAAMLSAIALAAAALASATESCPNTRSWKSFISLSMRRCSLASSSSEWQ